MSINSQPIIIHLCGSLLIVSLWRNVHKNYDTVCFTNNYKRSLKTFIFPEVINEVFLSLSWVLHKFILSSSQVFPKNLYKLQAHSQILLSLTLSFFCESSLWVTFTFIVLECFPCSHTVSQWVSCSLISLTRCNCGMRLGVDTWDQRLSKFIE